MIDLALVLVALAQSRLAAVDSPMAARAVVSQFYSWYVPLAARTPEAEMRALRDRRWHFSPALATALRADFAAAAQSPGEIVGLDGDPFLNAQDPCDRYAPTNVERDGTDYLVDVHGTGGCATHSGPDVIVRVRFENGRAMFVDFLYSRKSGDSLSGLLAQLAANRSKTRVR